MTSIATSALGQSPVRPLSGTECQAILQRACFGHLALTHDGNIEVLPIRYARVDDWVYFRATPELREVIEHHPWATLSVTEWNDVTHAQSVIARGACYATEGTGSVAGDATAMRGILALRDRAVIERPTDAHRERTTSVFRLHLSEVHGQTVFVPCPAGEREYDEAEVQRLRAKARNQSTGDDERADDDGMPEATPQPPRLRTN